MIYSHEVENNVSGSSGCYITDRAPIPEEAKWVTGKRD